MATDKKQLSAEQSQTLLGILKTRFDKNQHRHKTLKWENIETKLEKSPQKIWSLHFMEETGGEPDVIGYDQNTGEYLFCDCSTESPKGRRSICFDREGLESRKEHQPENNAVDLAGEMGIEIMSEQEYRALQELENFDLKTSSWIKTPAEIRKLGGALFADRRYDTVFIYHNGAQSYYAARGFRGLLRV